MSTSNGNSTDYPPSFRACKLYRKKSKAGATFFSGRWGGAKIALVKTKDVADNGEEIWALLLSEAPQKDEQPSQAKPNAPAAPYKSRTLDDDAIPF